MHTLVAHVTLPAKAYEGSAVMWCLLQKSFSFYYTGNKHFSEAARNWLRFTVLYQHFQRLMVTVKGARLFLVCSKIAFHELSQKIFVFKNIFCK